MSFFEDASLVLIPSAQKTSKVYSVKPTDGTGDLTFTRSNDTATRVGPDGLIEKVRTNRVLYSELQTDGLYSGTNIASVTAASNPLTGQNNAFKITSTTGNDPYFLQNVSGLSNGENTFSCWAWTDAGQSTEATLFFYNQTATEIYTKAITLTTTPTRYDHTVNFSNIGSIATVRIDLRQTGPTVQYVYTYGWQAESGVATSYIATTSAAVSVGPVANVPRLDYLNSSCPRLLLEPQRVNLTNWSEQMTLWANGTSSVTANATTSPDGYQNADRINNTADVSTFVSASNGVYTFSLFVKQGTSATASIDMSDGATGDVITTFTFATKTFSGTSAGGSWTSPSTAYQDYGNGWYRISLTATKGAGSTIGHKIIASGTGTTFVWGAQLEAGAYATSYIPTLGAAVTRGADAAFKTSASALIGQTEGTIFWEVEFTTMVATGHEGVLNIDDGIFGDTIYLFKGSTGTIVAEIYVVGVQQASFSTSTKPIGTYKMALAYANNNTAFFLNGEQVGTTDTSCSIPATNRIQLGNGGLGPSTDFTKQLLLFPTRLSNADLAALTA